MRARRQTCKAIRATSRLRGWLLRLWTVHCERSSQSWSQPQGVGYDGCARGDNLQSGLTCMRQSMMQKQSLQKETGDDACCDIAVFKVWAFTCDLHPYFLFVNMACNGGSMRICRVANAPECVLCSVRKKRSRKLTGSAAASAADAAPQHITYLLFP